MNSSKRWSRRIRKRIGRRDREARIRERACRDRGVRSTPLINFIISDRSLKSNSRRPVAGSRIGRSKKIYRSLAIKGHLSAPVGKFERSRVPTVRSLAQAPTLMGCIGSIYKMIASRDETSLFRQEEANKSCDLLRRAASSHRLKGDHATGTHCV